MSAKFLVRFDDICPTMNWSVWESVERTLDAWQIKPIVAVVPENRDPRLEAEPERADFWDRVRQWQGKRWAIGWHGYQHVYSSPSAGLVGVHSGSEFAGTEAEQRSKLESAARVFREQHVVPTVWVAPGHSFDSTTVKLLPQFGVATISDGHFLRAVKRGACVWVPQQLWRFRNVPLGLWTVCFHHNTWTTADIARFEQDLARFHDRIVSLTDVLNGGLHAHDWSDRIVSAAVLGLVRSRAFLRARTS